MLARDTWLRIPRSRGIATLIDGAAMAHTLRQDIAKRVVDLRPVITPRLVMVLVGTRADSELYVANKKHYAREVGISSDVVRMPADVSVDYFKSVMKELDGDQTIHGLLIQAPLPPHLNGEYTVCVEKDVDGFHAMNVGQLALQQQPQFVGCTPRAVMEMLRRSSVTLPGRHVVVLGKSRVVGLPLSLMLLHHNATVTVCNSLSHDQPRITRSADILVSAMGRPGKVTKEWVKPGAVVIDVGINRVSTPLTKSGFRFVGDCDPAVREVASLMTPVPGGVGPMTVAMLLRNTVDAAERVVRRTHGIRPDLLMSFT